MGKYSEDHEMYNFGNGHQTCRKSAVLRSYRSFCKKDRLNIGSYRSECPTRFFVQVLLDRDRDLNILTSMRARWRLRGQFPNSVHGRDEAPDKTKKIWSPRTIKRKTRKYMILNGSVQLINFLNARVS